MPLDDDVIICRCMELTRGELVKAIRTHDLKTLSALKRRTTAGMGMCQGSWEEKTDDAI